MDGYEDMQFAGFEDQKKDNGRSKTQAEVYKEIMEKSKKHKRERQKQYEENYEAAV